MDGIALRRSTPQKVYKLRRLLTYFTKETTNLTEFVKILVILI